MGELGCAQDGAAIVRLCGETGRRQVDIVRLKRENGGAIVLLDASTFQAESGDGPNGRGVSQGWLFEGYYVDSAD